MEKTNMFFIVLFIVAMNGLVFAQATHTIDFETPDTGQGWDWTVFDFAPVLTEMANPVSGGINTSATVMEFVADPSDQAWTGCWTQDDGEFTFDASNSTVTIMVYKDVISTVKMKFEGASAPVEVDAINTVTGAWELLTYDFSGVIGDTYDKLIVFPDFNFSRTVVTTSYFDNIQVPDGVVPDPDPEPTDAPPVPTHAEVDVIPIYTEVYTDLTGTDFNPNWGQSTSVTVDYMAAGNNTLQYTYLNYQGTQYTNQDVTAYEYLHVDFWTPSSTFLDFYLISPGLETFYSLPITLDTWVSVDIPLSHYVPPVNLSDVFQFKVVGDGTVYFDNWYFWHEPITPVELSTFTAVYTNGASLLEWTTQSESNNMGWNIYRSQTELEEAIQVNGQLIQGSGTTSEPTDYEFYDEENLVVNNTYYYWLESVSFSGETEIHNPISLTVPEPGQNPDEPEIISNITNYPNPFSSSTTISFNATSDQMQNTEVSIYNMKGQLIQSLPVVLNGTKCSAFWNGKDANSNDVSSGIYSYIIKSGQNEYTGKMILTR